MDSTLCGDSHYASFSSLQSALPLRSSSQKNDSLIKPLPPLSFQNIFTKRLNQQRHLHQLCLNEGSKCSGKLGDRSQITYSQWIPVQRRQCVRDNVLYIMQHPESHTLWSAATSHIATSARAHTHTHIAEGTL